MEEIFHELPCWRVTRFIWMIPWVKEAFIHHVFYHSHFVEAMGQQAGFHSHFLPLIDVGHLVFHTWEENLDDNFIADYLDAVLEAIDGRPQEEEGINLVLPINFIEDKKIFWGGGL